MIVMMWSITVRTAGVRPTSRSERTRSGYDKKTLASDVKALMDHLKIDRVHIIGHDIGARIAYAFAVQYPERLLSLTVAEPSSRVLRAPPRSNWRRRPIREPGISPSSQKLTHPLASTGARKKS